MIDNGIKVLLKKADELRALFVLGQNVIPFLEEIFVFVSEIQPLLDEINKSISDNLRKMPSASKQLSKVTEATELATNEIMDLVDGIVFNSDSISTNLGKLKKISDLESEKSIQVLELIYNAIENGVDVKDLLPELKSIINQLKQNSETERQEIIFNTKEILKTIQVDSSSIMMSLQVQDITSQQIAAVNKLLETIQDKLESILKHFRDSDLSDLVNSEIEEQNNGAIRVSKLHREIAFDPLAVEAIANKGFRQTEVDEYIRLAKEGKLNVDNEPTSQDDIDKLFAAMNDKEEITNENVEENFESSNNDDALEAFDSFNDALKDVDDFESISQDDIDKMFK